MRVITHDMTIPELARELGKSRVFVWKKVKAGKIPAHRVGNRYVIKAKDANIALGIDLTDTHRAWIRNTVGRVVNEYRPVLKKLSRE